MAQYPPELSITKDVIYRMLTIQIVSTENNKYEKSAGFQKIFYKSPLAHSLLGQTVGNIVKIGNLDNYVEILKITN